MPSLSPLPIDEILPAVLAGVRWGNVVLTAPPGAGKTTRVPTAIAASGALQPAKGIVMLQPRRIAARAAAARIAEEQQWRLGDDVGYQIRFENRTSTRTIIRVVTEGILTRRLQDDPFLEGIGCVILDEFHERSIHTDLALALLREVQTTVREDLRIVVMSATMDAASVASFLGDAVVLESQGRLFPVAIEHLLRPDSAPVHEQAASAVKHALSRGKEEVGHLLVFLPGIGEIRRTASLLQSIDADIHVLHSSVSSEDQDRALRPSAATKLILATNIAETSLTIDGVRTVIDTGQARVMVNDSRLGIDRLELRRISLASAAQRTGRAGRTAPGRCYRLWTRQDEAMMEDQEIPEIHRVDLAATLLAMHSFGVRDVRRFTWFDAPKADAVQRAETLLSMLGVVASNGELTSLGRSLSAFPLHPRLGKLMAASIAVGLVREAAGIAALLSERDLLQRGRGREAGWSGRSDVLDRLELLENGNGVDPAILRSVRKVRDDLEEVARKVGGKERGKKGGDDALLRLILQAYPDRVTVRRGNDPTRGVMVGGRGIVLEPTSVVRDAPIFLSLDPRESQDRRTESRVSIASSVELAWLESDFPHLVLRSFVHQYDATKEKVLTLRQTLFGDLPLSEEVAGPQVDPVGASVCLYEALSGDPERFFRSDEDATLFLLRVRFLRAAMPELGLPVFERAELRAALKEACEGCWTVEKVRAKNLSRQLESVLDWTQRAALDREAPIALQVPSGSRIRLNYEQEGPPVLAARLQELFGLASSPRVAAGRVSVLLHLLAPNYRPVQVTADLTSFWNKTYQEVRKELRARYPKHAWPEDPWNAPPEAKGRRRS